MVQGRGLVSFGLDHIKSPLRLNFSLFFHATVTIGLDLGQLLPKTFDLLLRDLGADRWGRGGDENSQQ